MMHSETTKIVLDACVLAEAAVSDLLSRLAEDPGLIDVRWSLPIWEQTRSAWIGKLGWSPSVADRRIHAACTTFPEAMVEGFAPWIDACFTPQRTGTSWQLASPHDRLESPLSTQMNFRTIVRTMEHNRDPSRLVSTLDRDAITRSRQYRNRSDG